VLPLAGPERYTTISRAAYPDGSRWWVVAVIEVRDGRIFAAETYFAPEFEAPRVAPRARRADVDRPLTAGTLRGARARSQPEAPIERPQRPTTVHGEAANAGHRVLASDDAEVEAYLETALDAPPPQRDEDEPRSGPDTVAVLDFGASSRS
jgi:hypothetical protein